MVRQFGKLTNEISVRDYDDYYKRKFTTHKRASVSRLVIKMTIFQLHTQNVKCDCAT